MLVDVDDFENELDDDFYAAAAADDDGDLTFAPCPCGLARGRH